MPTYKYVSFLDAVVALFFGMCAYFQLNDPDPVLWFGIYSVAGLVALSLFFNRTTAIAQQMLGWSRWPLLLLTLCFGVYCWPWSEEQWRELGGIMLLTLWVWLRHVPATQKAAFEP